MQMNGYRGDYHRLNCRSPRRAFNVRCSDLGDCRNCLVNQEFPIINTHESRIDILAGIWLIETAMRVK